MSAIAAPSLATARRTPLFWLWLCKEVRAQAPLLAAYLALTFLALGASLWMRAETRALDEHRLLVVALFVLVGALGALAFAAPACVRGELVGRASGHDDQLLRRLPGALPAATLAKLTFTALAALGLPLVCFAAAQGFLALRGLPLLTADELTWSSLQNLGGNLGRGLSLLLLTGYGLTLAPWVLAMASWLPGGRMAPLAVAAIATLVLAAVQLTLQACPGLDDNVRAAWPRWLWWLVPTGMVTAWLSLARGRRGGGAWRSAQVGVPIALLALGVPAAWFGVATHHYLHPRVDRIAGLHVHGLTPDGQFAVGRAGEAAHWFGVPVHIDLRDGSMRQIGGLGEEFTNEVARPWQGLSGAPRRFWRLYGRASQGDLVDAAQGTRLPMSLGAPRLGLPDTVHEQLGADLRAHASFALPQGRRAWLWQGQLHVETEAGVTTQPWPYGVNPVRNVGHGVLVLERDAYRLFDLVRRREIAPAGFTVGSGFAVGGLWLVLPRQHNGQGAWQVHDPDTAALEACPELRGCGIVGLWSDEEVLATPHGARDGRAPFVFRPRDRRVTPIDLPTTPPSHWVATSSDLLRDPHARVWLRSDRLRSGDRTWFGIDRETLRPAVQITGNLDLLGFADADSALFVEDERRIVRIALPSLARTVVFPRRDG